VFAIGFIGTANGEEEATAAKLYKDASLGVVEVICYDKILGKDKEVVKGGSGFFVKHKGNDALVVTSFHVIRGCPLVTVKHREHKEVEVSEVLTESRTHDLAVLAVPMPDGRDIGKLKLNANAAPPIGSQVYVIGSPKGLTNTLSEGLVSGYRKRDDGSQWVQISAPISPGSSGGPVIDETGQVLGVATASIVDGQNLNFAVPVSDLLALLRTTPRPRPVWKGASVIDEERAAYDAVKEIIDARFSKEHPEFAGAKRKPKPYQQFLKRKADQGDQLAIIVRGDLLRVLEPEETIHQLRGVSNIRNEYQYLVMYTIQKGLWWQELGEQQSYDNERLELLHQITRLKPEFAPAWHRIAWIYIGNEDYVAAMPASLRLLDLVPDCPEAHWTRGVILEKTGRSREALKAYSEAIKLRPTADHFYASSASLHVSLEEYDKAVELYDKAIECNPREEIEWTLYYNRGNAYEQMGKSRAAFESFTIALRKCRDERLKEDVRKRLIPYVSR